MDDSVLVWMDLETTGPAPERDRIVAIAAVVTNGALDVVAEGPSVDVREGQEADAERAILEFVRAHAAEGAAPLAGARVHRNRRFLARVMPALERHLHYRVVDVSTVRELASRWYPVPFATAPVDAGGARALEGIRASLAELRYYRDAIFRPRPG